MGQSDNPSLKAVKLYCGKCEDLYNPKSSRHAAIDGAYFGTSFHNILFQVYPALLPGKSARRYEPRIFGFKVHAAAALQRWQDVKRGEMKRRLTGWGMEHGFEDEDFYLEGSEDEEGEGAGAGAGGSEGKHMEMEVGEGMGGLDVGGGEAEAPVP